jgi:carbamoylphosphate synthase large subunit
VHIATITHDGRIWEVYMDFEPDLHYPATYRARLRFESSAGEDGPVMARTAVIIIEDSYEEAVAKARSFAEHQLQGLIRSALPDDSED